MRPIVPGLYRLPGMTVGNVYLSVDADGLTLIDTSIPPSAKKILAHVAALGYAPSAIKRILITHGHPDHIGGLPELKRATGAQVYASAGEQPVIEGRAPVMQVPPENRIGLARLFVPPATTMPGTSVDRVVQDGDVLPEVMGGMQVVSTPGHAPDHLAFWQPEQRILFCGDVLFHLPNLRLPFSFFTVDMQQNKRSIRRVADLDPAIVCFGHGKPITQHTAQIIRVFAEKQGV